MLKLEKKEQNAVEEVELLEDIMGSMKKYQWIVVISMYMIRLPPSWHLTGHGIMIPETEPVYCSNTTVSHTGILSAEAIKELHKEACSPSCPKIEVGQNFYLRSIIDDYELYCDRMVLRMVSQLLVMAGVFFGCFIFGYYSDRFGRKGPMIIAILGQPLFGIWVAFSPGIVSFLIAKFFLNIFVGGVMVTGFVFFSECIGKRWRAIMGLLYLIPFSFGWSLMPGIAYIFYKDWRILQMVISLPSLIFLYLIWYLYESPRWLLAVGKVEEGITNLEKIAKHNGLPTENIRERILAEMERRRDNNDEERNGTIRDLFRTRFMALITIALYLNWFSISCSFYGMGQLSSTFTHSFYINCAISGVIQIPGSVFSVWSCNAWGRRWSIVFGNAIVAIGCICVVFTPSDYKIIPAAMTMFGLGLLFSLIYLYSVELFPTIIRNIGIGSASSIGRVGGMLSPVFEYLKTFGFFIPPLLFASLSVMAGFAIFFAPETKGRVLPNTVEDLNELKKPNTVKQ